MSSNEKRLSFIIDPSKAKKGAEALKESLEGVKKAADGLQQSLNAASTSNTQNTNKSTKAVDANASAYKRLLKASRDYNTSQGKSVQFLKTQLQQQKAYQKALIDTLSVSQKMTLAETAQKKELESVKRALSLVNNETGKSLVENRNSLKVKRDLIKVQDELAKSNTAEYKALLKSREELKQRRKELLGTTKSVSEAERAQNSLAKSLAFWQQKERDLQSSQAQKIVKLKETVRQTESYRKSLVDAISPAQRLAKAKADLNRSIANNANQLSLYTTGLKQKEVVQKTELSLQRQLAQSQAKLAQTYSKEYVQLIKNNEAIKKRRRELLGLDQAQKKVKKSAGMGAGAGAVVGVFGAVSSGMVLRDLVATADAYTSIQNRLAVVSAATVDLTKATRDLLDISIESRTELDATMDVYSKLVRVTKNYNTTQGELYKITETVSKAVAMSGASAQGAQGALLQFSQALSGNFQASAQELNSIIEQTPALGVAIADALNSVDSSLNANLGNLKALAKEGRITTEMLLQGFLNISDSIDKQFNNSIRTVSQSLTSLRSAFTVVFGEIDRAFGGSGSLAESITNLAKELTNFKAEIAGASAALVAFIGSAGLIAMVSMLSAAAAAVIGLAAAVAGLTYQFVKAITEVKLIEAETQSLKEQNDNLKASLDGVIDTYSKFSTNKITSEISELEDKMVETENRVKSLKEELSGQFGNSFFDNVLKSTPVGAFFDNITQDTSKVKALKKAIDENNKSLGIYKQQLGALKGALDLAFMAGNIFTGAVEDQDEATKNLIKSLGEEVNAQDILLRKKAEAILLQQAYVKANEQGIEINVEFVKQILAQEDILKKIMSGLNKTSKSTRNWAEDLESLRRSLDPSYEAQQRMEESMLILNKTVEKGTPLYKQMAEAIRKDYTEAIKDAREETEKLPESIENVRNAILGTEGAYKSYYDMVGRVVDSTATQAEKVELINLLYGKLNKTLSEGGKLDAAPSVSGEDSLDGMSKFTEEERKVNEWYDNQLLKIDEFRLLKADREAEWNALEQEAFQIHNDKLQAIEAARQEAQLMGAQTTFANLSSLAGAFFGEQSGIYKAMFAMEKAFAVAKALMNAPKAYSDAYAATVGIPIIGPALAPVAGAAASAAMVAQAASIQGVTFTGMAHSGIDSVPQTGTWLLEKGERVTTKDTSARLDRTLARIEGGMSESGRSGSTVNQTINVSGSVDSKTANQLARESSRKQRIAESRFGK